MSSARPSAGLVLPTILTIAALAVLIGLGTWQLQRKAWKDGLIAQIAARTTAPAIALEEALARASKGEDLEYTRVAVTGRWVAADREAHLWAPTTAGPGWHIYTPLVTAAAPVVIVNRGFVADAQRDPSSRREPDAAVEVRLVGLLRKSEVKAMFTPDNAPDRNIWYWRDLDAMGRALLPDAKARLAPFFLDAEKGSPAGPLGPKGGVTRLNIPNSHLQYAVTWYGLALTLVGVYTAFAWGRLQRRREAQLAAT